MKRDFFLKKNNIFLITAVLYVILTLFFYYQTRDYAIEKATEKIEDVLLNTKALRKYVSIQKNEIYRLQSEGYIDKDYFSPIVLSSTYISKQVNNIYNHLRAQKQKDAITIRFAAPNPRNDANLASEKEQKLLQLFNEKKLQNYKELIDTKRGKAIYYATPTRVTTAACAVCHTDPGLAPKGLVQMYGDEKGFYEHNGNIRALLSTTYPIQKELNDAKFFFYILAISTFIALFIIMLILSRYINIIKEKQKQLFDTNKTLQSKVEEQTKEIVSQHRYLDLILNSSPNLVLVSDIESLIFPNDAFYTTFTQFSDVKNFNEKNSFKDFIYFHYCQNKTCSLENQYTKMPTKQQWLQLFLDKDVKLCFYQDKKNSYYNINTTKIKDDKKEHYLHIISNITELEKAKLQLEELSIKDELTNLYNRRYFNQIYTQEKNRALRDDCYFVFVIFDIDYFKNYNDNLGHIKGDIALQKVAQQLKSDFSRGGDFCFRLGGEEFGIITTTNSKDLIKEHIIQFHHNINSLNIIHPDSNVAPHLTISLGVFVKKVANSRGLDFYKEADKLLYKAKERRNSVVFNF